MAIKIVFPPPESLMEELAFSNTARNKNTRMIKKQYTRLKLEVAEKLSAVVEDMERFNDYILDTFEAGDLPQVSSVKEMFRLLTRKEYWKFTDVFQLEEIVEEFGGEFQKECKQLIDEYKKDLNGYNCATRIVEFMTANKEKDAELPDESKACTHLMEDKEKYDEKFRTKLSIKLEGRQGRTIYLESLQYVERLWDSLCFEFKLKSLPHVLDGIVEGSVIIHWIIQHKFTWKILGKLADDGDITFFEKNAIAILCLEGVCVYNQRVGIRHGKVCL